MSGSAGSKSTASDGTSGSSAVSGSGATGSGSAVGSTVAATKTRSNYSTRPKSRSSSVSSRPCFHSSCANNPSAVSCSSAVSGPSVASALQFGSSCSSCRPAMPSRTSEMLSMNQASGPKEGSMKDIEDAGYKMGELIVEDDCYRFYTGTKGSKRVIFKQIQLDKCTPRYRANMNTYSLKIERYMGGVDDDKVKCDSFIRIYDIFKVDQSIYTVMEEVPGKSLYLRLFDNDKVDTELARTWTVQIVEGLVKMHEVGVAHRFLKLQHILYDRHEHVKIAGWSKAVPFWEPTRQKALLQRKERRSRKNLHLPPECFRLTYDPSRVDIWSVGVLMVAMQTRRYPFNPKSEAKFSAQWRHFVATHKMNKLIRNALNKAFFIDPEKRSRPSDFLKLPYFKASADKIAELVMKSTKDPKHQESLGYDASLHVSKVMTSSTFKSKSKVKSSIKSAAKSSVKSSIKSAASKASAPKSATAMSKATPTPTKASFAVNASGSKVKSSVAKSSKAKSKSGSKPKSVKSTKSNKSAKSASTKTNKSKTKTKTKSKSKTKSKTKSASSKGPASCQSASVGKSSCPSASGTKGPSSCPTASSIGPSNCSSASTSGTRGPSSCPTASSVGPSNCPSASVKSSIQKNASAAGSGGSKPKSKSAKSGSKISGEGSKGAPKSKAPGSQVEGSKAASNSKAPGSQIEGSKVAKSVASKTGVGSQAKSKGKSQTGFFNSKEAKEGAASQAPAGSKAAGEGSQGAGVAVDDPDPGEDQAKGDEGGAVDDQVPPNEAAFESPEAEAAAPEEQADQAVPVNADPKA